MGHIDNILEAIKFRKILLDSLKGLAKEELEKKLKEKIKELKDERRITKRNIR